MQSQEYVSNWSFLATFDYANARRYLKNIKKQHAGTCEKVSAGKS